MKNQEKIPKVSSENEQFDLKNKRNKKLKRLIVFNCKNS